jgi:hypothetical protein
MPKRNDDIWIAVRISEAGGGGAAEYCGRISRKVLEELKKPSGAPSLFKLDDAFWIDDHGAFTFIGRIKNYGYEDACYFRSDRIARLVMLRADFVRQILKQRAKKENAKSPQAPSEERRKYTSIL